MHAHALGARKHAQAIKTGCLVIGVASTFGSNALA